MTTDKWIPFPSRDTKTHSKANVSAQARVQAAVEAARAGNADPSLNDITKAGSMLIFDAEVDAVIRDFMTIRDAVQRVVSRSENGGFADPVLVAALRMFPPPTGIDAVQHAEQVVALHQNLGSLLVNEEASPHTVRVPRGRPAPHRSDPKIRAAVSAAMHCCYDETGRYSGGWHSNRTTATGAIRGDDEFSVKGSAAYVVDLVRAAGVEANLRDIKTYMDVYAKELRAANRAPETGDYIRDFSGENHNK